ncbi:Arm DNA-binding domain-containing protein [Burkholderia pseudomallei]|uniref:Arm DNA-binding domain-containing protein n=1 Tax=Burkholderia pseudomallei TaxID=28450 RepID=UPI002181E49C|nr:Arm DNA-binding domain-containing protein [Burkholderia pseudomallei]
MPLTDVQCRSAKPRSQSYKLRDEKGLYLEVKPTGSKTWRYRFELFGKESIYTIGEYPSVTLLDARDARRAARGPRTREARQEPCPRKAARAHQATA